MADTTSKKANVATPSSAYQRMAPRWDMIDALLGGTEAMRAAGEKYLPQYDAESNKSYQNRLAAATLFNMTEQTLNSLAGKPFEEQIVLGDDVSAEIEDLLEDVDQQGNNLQAFCRAWFREAWAKGFSHVLVEHATPEPLEEGEQRTLADDRAEGLRPYWVHISPECVIAAYSQMLHGKETLTHVRILETSVEQVGWEEAVKVRVRVLEPGSWQLWAPKEKGKEDKDWVVESEGTTDLDYIPLVTFYTAKRTGLMECKPPLTDLAHLNVTHWQSGSDQRNVLTVSRFPILAGAGVPADYKIEVGPNRFLTTEAPEGKWYYVEHTGAAISAGQTDLESLENQMASYGAEFLRKKTGNETATGRALDSAEAVSYLGATVMDFQDSIELALQYTANWLGQEEGGSVILNHDLGISETDASALDTLMKMRAARDISRKTLLGEMQARGILSDDFDEEADQELLEEEGKNTLGDMFNGGNGTRTPPIDPNNPNPNNPQDPPVDPNNPNPPAPAPIPGAE